MQSLQESLANAKVSGRQ